MDRQDEVDRLTRDQAQALFGWLISAADDDTWAAALQQAQRF